MQGALPEIQASQAASDSAPLAAKSGYTVNCGAPRIGHSLAERQLLLPNPIGAACAAADGRIGG